MQIVYKKGFTLIELLVVIAIIGILAGIVLASLGSARSGANDAKTKEQLSSLRTAMETYYGSNGGYGTAGTSCSTVGSAFANSLVSPLVTTSNYPSGTTLACQNTANAWAVSATLSTAGQFWCVDSTGTSKQTAAAVSSTVCP